jgi:hypothetical protein
LACYENGTGALNLPITRAQLGAQNARSAHPVALTAIGDLIELVTGKEFKVRLPFLFWTKAEMCENLPRGELGGVVALTVSCDGFPGRRKGSPHCGKCTSCVLRRHALHVGGLGHLDAADGYEVSMYASPSDEPIEALQAMNHQVDTLRGALAQPPLFRIDIGKETFWALDDTQKDQIVKQKTGRATPETLARRVRGLRHSTSSILHYDGVPYFIIQAILGHTTLKTTGSSARFRARPSPGMRHARAPCPLRIRSTPSTG